MSCDTHVIISSDTHVIMSCDTHVYHKEVHEDSDKISLIASHVLSRGHVM